MSFLFDLFVRTCPSKTDFVVISFHLEMVYFALKRPLLWLNTTCFSVTKVTVRHYLCQRETYDFGDKPYFPIFHSFTEEFEKKILVGILISHPQ